MILVQLYIAEIIRAMDISLIFILGTLQQITDIHLSFRDAIGRQELKSSISLASNIHSILIGFH